MTTLAYNNGELAADGQQSRSDNKAVDSITKIWAVPEGLVGFTGAIADGWPMIEWLKIEPDKRVTERPQFSEATVVLVRHDRTIVVHEGTGHFEMRQTFAAWGTGAAAALAAMHMGASAAKAVEVASLVDIYTGGKIVTLALPHRPQTEGRE